MPRIGEAPVLGNHLSNLDLRISEEDLVRHLRHGHPSRFAPVSRFADRELGKSPLEDEEIEGEEVLRLIGGEEEP